MDSITKIITIKGFMKSIELLMVVDFITTLIKITEQGFAVKDLQRLNFKQVMVILIIIIGIPS